MSRILIVDDNEQNLYILRILLEGAGFQVEEAENGRDALTCLEEKSFALLITDLLMPVMDGFELCRTVRNNSVFATMPILVYTATYTEPEDERLALSLGADRFLVKPTNPDELIEIVSDMVARGGASENSDSSSASATSEDTDIEREYRKRVAIKLEKKLKQLEAEIADRTRLEIELKEREAQYRCIFESVSEGLLILDLEGKIVELNPAACRMYGYSRSQALGLSWIDLASPESVEALFVYLSDPRGEGFRDSGEHVRADGATMAVELRGDLFNFRGSQHFLAAVSDVSEQRRLKEQLLHSQKMEAIGRLAGGIAHDFNNLLQAILANADIVEFEMPRQFEFRQEIAEITTAAEKATALAGQLLAFSRNQVLNRRDLNLNTAVRSILDILSRLIGEDVTIKTVLETDLDAVHADLGQMEQVIMNLCVNARDAMPRGGEMTIETATIEVDEESAHMYPWAKIGAYVCLRVMDTGVGMDQETLERAFDPFYTTKGPEKGSGLGLATAYGIVRQHDGMIVADSEPGQGTTVSVFIPTVNRQVRPSEEERTSQALSRGEETILVGEDDDAVRRVLTRILEDAGYTVVAAEDGEQAWAAFEQHRHDIDLVILDLVMPRLSGAELRRRILAERRDMRFLMTSGHSYDRYHAEDLDDLPIILKPYRYAEILTCVRDALDQT